jgi:hypothetical protein
MRKGRRAIEGISYPKAIKSNYVTRWTNQERERGMVDVTVTKPCKTVQRYWTLFPIGTNESMNKMKDLALPDHGLTSTTMSRSD